MPYSIQTHIDSDITKSEISSITKKYNIDFKFILKNKMLSGGNPLYQFSSPSKSSLIKFISTQISDSPDILSDITVS